MGGFDFNDDFVCYWHFDKLNFLMFVQCSSSEINFFYDNTIIDQIIKIKWLKIS